MINNTTKSFLCFLLGNDKYAANVDFTLKILQYTDITKVPNSPKNVIGVINHHGNVLPVVDLKNALNLPQSEIDANTCIIILSLSNAEGSIDIGVIVDEVLSVVEVKAEDISEAPSLGGINLLDHLDGVFKELDKFVMILNIRKLLGDITTIIED